MVMTLKRVSGGCGLGVAVNASWIIKQINRGRQCETTNDRSGSWRRVGVESSEVESREREKRKMRRTAESEKERVLSQRVASGNYYRTALILRMRYSFTVSTTYK